MKTSPRHTRRAFLACSAQVTTALYLTRNALWADQRKTASFRIQAESVRGMAIGFQDRIVVAADSRLLFFQSDGRLVREVTVGCPVRAVTIDPKGQIFATVKEQVARLNEAGTLEMLGAPLGRQSALTGVAVADNGDIYAADSGERLVWRLDSAGEVKGRIKPSDDGFSVLRSFFPIAWRNGRLLVADPGRHQIQTYSPEGKLLARWGERTRELEGFGGCCNPVSFAALPNGTIVTAERGQPRVKAFDADGRLHRLLAGPEEFEASRKAALDEVNDLFACQAGILDVAASPEGAVFLLDRTTREIRRIA